METIRVPGFSRADMLDELRAMIPPVRPEGFGMTIPEATKALGVSQHYAKALLEERGYIPINLRRADSGSGSDPVVYAPPEAAEQYREWIVKE